MRSTSQIGQSPFKTITDFRDFATGPTARVQLKDSSMDLVHAIHCTGHCRDALVSARAAIVSGQDPKPFIDDAMARFKDQATALGFLIEPIDDAAMVAVESREAAE